MPTQNEFEKNDELEMDELDSVENQNVADEVEEVDPDHESTLLSRAHVLSSVLGSRGGATKPQPLLVVDALEDLANGKILQPQQINAIRDYAGAIIQIMDNERSFLVFRSLLEKINL